MMLKSSTRVSWALFLLAVLVVADITPLATAQFPTLIPRRTTKAKTTATTTKTTTTRRTTTTRPTTASTSTTTFKPYTFTKPQSCTAPPPYNSTAKSLNGAETRRGSCTAPAAPKQVMSQSVRWPNGTLPYIISDDYAQCQRDLILAAMYEIGNKTNGCIKFIPKRDTDVNFVRIVNTKVDVCQSSAVGYQGNGEQTINLSDHPNYDGNWGFCFYSQQDGYAPGSGLAAHELLHTLGFQHEHQRPDRNQSIVVNYENILDGYAFNFDIPEGQTVIGPYDLKSVMHYRADAFAKDGTHSMDSIIPGQQIEEGDFLTNTDVYKLKTYYNCP